MKTAAAAAMAASANTDANISVAKTETPKQRNPFRYTSEFLLRIRDERAKLIDNICPEIFREYSYCISGTLWDPEKYFNAILHGERLKDFINNANTSNNSVVNNNKNFKSSLSGHPHQYQHRPLPYMYNNNNNHNNKYDNNARRWPRKTMQVDNYFFFP